MELEMLREVIDELVSGDPRDHSDGASIIELHRDLSRLQAYVAAATAVFDTSREWAADGARTAGAWLAAEAKLPRRAAGRQIKLARAVQDLPVVGEAWRAGDINTAQVEAIVGARNPRTEAALARDQQFLVDQARTLPYPDFCRVVKYWGQHADPDGAEADSAKQVNDRRVHLSQTMNGMWIGDLRLDPIGGTILADELNRLEKQLFEEEWAETKERLGHDPSVKELPRTPAQRRADALVEMAKRSKTMPEGGYSPRPLFTVLVGYETLHGRICELANGTVVSPGALVRWLDQALIERAVFTPTGRVEISARTRLFKGATRRAIEVRDRRCTHPYCDEPVDRCQVDHTIPYEAGGPTTQENGRLRCGFHNRFAYQEYLRRNGRGTKPRKQHHRRLRLRARRIKRRTTGRRTAPTPRPDHRPPP